MDTDLLHLVLAQGLLHIASIAIHHVALLQDAFVHWIVVLKGGGTLQGSSADLESDEREPARLAGLLVDDDLDLESPLLAFSPYSPIARHRIARNTRGTAPQCVPPARRTRTAASPTRSPRSGRTAGTSRDEAM